MTTTVASSILVADLIGVMLVLTLYFSNQRRPHMHRDMRLVTRMLWMTLVACVADLTLACIDGQPGMSNTVLLYVCGSLLFLMNVLTSLTWVKFIIIHLSIPFSNQRKHMYVFLLILSCALLAVNLFYPCVFSAQDNVYARAGGFWFFTCVIFLALGDSLYLYIKCRAKVGMLRVFPVYVFLVPILTGTIVQTLFTELTIGWPSVAVAMAGVMSALKNEVIFTDRLTGLHNRVYLEFLQQEIQKKKKTYVSGIMIDLNDFKQINDQFGHSMGDAALIATGDILNRIFGEYGVVMRYAGDEFIVLLNITDTLRVEQLMEEAHQAFADFNRTNSMPYRLSAAMGFAILDLKTQTMDEFMNRIDHEMYKEKNAYYSQPGRNRRKG
ncbi:MAG: GGDEF domain-containing protein [Aristaeellaceae bacterium]